MSQIMFPELLEKEIQDARNSLSTERLDMSFGEIMSMYERDEIVIDPEFQRLFRWTNYQRSRFIESLLLGIPIPPIFVAEDRDGKWELVDGLQRLSTVLSFFGMLKGNEKNGWVLDAGDIIKSLDNIDINNLPQKFRLNIKRAVCRIEVIKWNSKYDMRYELFNRLNTGGAPLTDQEIRNCIFRGISSKFNEYLKRASNNKEFIDIVNPSAKQLSELYLEELVLRFSSLYKNSENIKKNISQHMTDYMRDSVHDAGFDYNIEELFHRTIKVLHPLGNEIFKAMNGNFSTSLFDAITVSIAENIDKYENMKTPDLVQKVNEIKNNSEFNSLMGSSASSKTRVKKRQQIAREIFQL